MIRFGLIGAGRIGKAHAASIIRNSEAKLLSVAGGMSDAAKILAHQAGAQIASTEDILNSPDIDAVIIAAPTPVHAELIEMASRAGKAIFCEKPVSLSVDRINRCLDVVEKNRSILMIGFHRRFDANFSRLQRQLRQGEVGEIEIIVINSRDRSPPSPSYVRSSGGLFRDMMIHDLDMARFLMGEEFSTVTALGASIIDEAIGAEGDVDTAAVQMQTASGRIVVITNSRRAVYGFDQRVEVHGSLGKLNCHSAEAASLEFAPPGDLDGRPVPPLFVERYNQAYSAEISSFIEAVKTGSRTLTPNGFDGLQAQKLADAAALSRAESCVVHTAF